MLAPALLAVATLLTKLTLDRLVVPKAAVALSTIPIFFFLAFRYDYGNDYWAYYDTFRAIAAGPSKYSPQEQHVEFGWWLLNKSFESAGFIVMVGLLAALTAYCYYKFVWTFVPIAQQGLALLLLILIPENMLILSSAMRQSVATCMLLLSIEYIASRRPLIFTALISVAGLFHTSAFFLWPIYLLAAPRLDIPRWSISVLLGVYCILFVFSDIAVGELASAVQLATDRYDVYVERGSIGSGLLFVATGIYLYGLAALHNTQNHAGRVLFKLGIIGCLLFPLGASLQMLARFNYYFTILSVATVFLLLNRVKPELARIGLTVGVLLFGGYQFFQFFESPVWRPFFSEYNSLLFTAFSAH